MHSLWVCSILSTFFRFQGWKTLKWFFCCCKIKYDFPCVKHFLLGSNPLRNFHFLFIFHNLYFSFIYFLNFHLISLGVWWRGLQSLVILWKLVADWDSRILWEYFWASPTAWPALMGLYRMISEFLRSLSRKLLLPLVPKMITS